MKKLSIKQRIRNIIRAAKGKPWEPVIKIEHSNVRSFCCTKRVVGRIPPEVKDRAIKLALTDVVADALLTAGAVELQEYCEPHYDTTAITCRLRVLMPETED